MKELARYIGKVINLNLPPTPSSVILTEVATQKSIETTIISEALIKEGVGMGDEFEVIIQQSIDGSIGGIFRKKGIDTGSNFEI